MADLDTSADAMTTPDADRSDLRASVVLCILNAEATLEPQLEALARQVVDGPWELLVVDNGCTDGSLDIVERWKPQIERLRVIDARDQRGLAHARNVGAQAAHSEVVAFCDADDVVADTWVAEIAKACQDADIVGGTLELGLLNTDEPRYWKGGYYENNGSPTDGGLPRIHHSMPFALGANFAVRRRTFLSLGGCDEQFTGSSDDVDISWRVQLSGGTLGFAPDAVVHYRLRSDLRTARRQQWNYGRTEARLRRKFGETARRDPLRNVLAVYWYLISRCHQLVRGSRLRGRWVCTAAYRLGRLRGAIDQRVLWW